MIARASPNIAFLKYWGKQKTTTDEDRNLALNPSLSMTLSKAYTETSVRRAMQSTVELNGAPALEKDFFKVQSHIERVCNFFQYSAKTFAVKSQNNFPQGTGLASSASGFAALTWALVAEILGTKNAEKFFFERIGDVSTLARRGSGSASRSVAGPFMKWDGVAAITCPLEWKLYDTIVIFSREEKKVSSSEGHELATTSPYFVSRLQKLARRMERLEEALYEKRLSSLGPILELEADEMHQIAGTSHPAVIYAGEDTRKFLDIIRSIESREFFYTLDAGPNVHLISERPIQDEVALLLRQSGLRAEIWEDQSGTGPCIITS